MELGLVSCAPASSHPVRVRVKVAPRPFITDLDQLFSRPFSLQLVQEDILRKCGFRIDFRGELPGRRNFVDLDGMISVG